MHFTFPALIRLAVCRTVCQLSLYTFVYVLYVYVYAYLYLGIYIYSYVSTSIYLSVSFFLFFCLHSFIFILILFIVSPLILFIVARLFEGVGACCCLPLVALLLAYKFYQWRWLNVSVSWHFSVIVPSLVQLRHIFLHFFCLSFCLSFGFSSQSVCMSSRLVRLFHASHLYSFIFLTHLFIAMLHYLICTWRLRACWLVLRSAGIE